MPDLDALGRRIGATAARAAALFVLSNMRRLEEDHLRPGARWEILRRRFAWIAEKRTPEPGPEAREIIRQLDESEQGEHHE